MRTRPASRESSVKLALPPGGAWSSAVVVTESGVYEQPRGGRGGIGMARFYFARLTLVLSQAAGGEHRVPLADGYEGADAAEALAISDATWRLATPPDGRGVACAREGEDAWRWICTDGARPFHCPHLLLGGPGMADPCAKAPRFRDLALEMMAPPAAGSIHPEGPDAAEWSELARAVAADVTDLELLDAFARAALREHSGLNLATVDPASLGAIQAVTGGAYVVLTHPRHATIQPGIRDSARAALDGKSLAGSVVASNACQLLAKASDERSQLALSATLLSEDWAPPATVDRDPDWPRAVAWSLARSVMTKGSIAEGAETRMTAFLKREVDKVESALPVLFALATHGSPEAREAVSALGRECGEKDLPPWPSSLDDLWRVAIEDHGALTHGLAAWAKAAPTNTR